MAVTGGIIAVAGTVYGAERAESRAEEQIEAQEDLASKESAIRANQAARARRKTVAAARVERARVTNIAASEGQQGSSAVIAGAGSASAQAASNIFDINTQVSSMETVEGARQNVINASLATPGIGESIFSNVGSQFTGALVNKGAQSLFES